MKNTKDDLYNTLVPSLKDRFFQQQLNFEEEQAEEINSGKKYFKYTIYAVSLALGVGVFSYLAYTSYKYSTNPESIEDIPLVKRDLTPIRIVPTDPGGEKFSNQDKLIYNNLLDNTSIASEAIDSEPKTKEPELVEVIPIPKKLPVVQPEPVEKKSTQEPITQIKEIETQEAPKKITTPIKTKVAKKPKKIDNPFDILDNDMDALDSTKLKN